MCHTHAGDEQEPALPTRRGFLGAVGAGILVPAALHGLRLPAADAASAAATLAPAPAVLPSGRTAYRAAMHLHGSFSEGDGSWMQHVSQALATGVDIVVPTDHDWRVMLRNYGGAFHFSGLTEATPNGSYQLIKRSGTNLATGAGGSLVSGAAPADLTARAGSLLLNVRQKKAAVTAVSTYEIGTGQANQDLIGTMLGRTVRFWVYLTTASTPSAYLALRLTLSRDPVNGVKTMTYRLRTDRPEPVVTPSGATAVVDVPVTAGQWHEVVLDVAADVAEAWPTLVVTDCAITNFVLLGQASASATVQGRISYFSVVTDPAYDPATALSSVLDPLRAANPGLLMPHGLEHSVDQHLGQIGGEPFFYDYAPSSGTHTTLSDAVTADQVSQIQAHAGVASYNHPFGTAGTSPTGTARTKKLKTAMTHALGVKLYGADAIEVGYVSRGMDLAGHLELWDCLSANGQIYTGVGVSDDHMGNSWSTVNNRFVTLPVMAELSEPALVTALRSGRAAVGLLGDFTGALDLSVNRVAYQGQAYVGPADPGDVLVVEGAGLPAGSVVQVYRGPVDLRGTSFTRPTVIASLAAQTVMAEPVSLPMTYVGACYYRVTVVNGSGRVLAFTNPVFVVPGGAAWIPPHRVASAATSPTSG